MILLISSLIHRYRVLELGCDSRDSILSLFLQHLEGFLSINPNTLPIAVSAGRSWVVSSA
jgi:hypothetical protein